MKVTSRDLKHFIEKGNIENVYLFSGPEIGEKKEVISLLKQKLFPGEEPVIYTFYCDGEFDSSDFINTLQAGMLFTSRKLVFLKNVESISADAIKTLEKYLIPHGLPIDKFENEILNKLDPKGKKKILTLYDKEKKNYVLKGKIKVADKKKLIEYLGSVDYKHYDPDTFLVMLNETNDRITTRLTDLLTPHQHIVFWEMFENQKVDWIRNQFKKHDLYVDDDSVHFLLDMVTNNKEQLEKEIEKIAILFDDKTESGAQRVINLSIIEEYIYHAKEETPFSLYSAMLDKNLSKALTLLESLFLTDEYSLLNGLVWSHRRFFKALDLYENQKIPPDEIFKMLRIFMMSNKDEFKRAFRTFSFSHISMMFYYISELDYALKTLPHDLKLVRLQEFIINFILGDKKKSFLQGPLHFVSF